MKLKKKKGVYYCAGCGKELFSSEHKFDSGTGWPSFFQPVDDAIETKTDFKIIIPRTEVHCKECGGSYFDAGEFRDYLEDEIYEQFQDVIDLL